MKTVCILLDSLNRNYLNRYGGGWVHTPAIDRLAARGLTFDNHYAGSLPCMPARREMMTGRHNFLESPWGPIEPWDECLPVQLGRDRDTYSHLITDHYHYFHSGGEAYHTLFSSWEFLRGQEGDVWRPTVKAPDLPAGVRGKGNLRTAYWRNRDRRNSELDEEYSTPQCFMRAMDFLEQNHESDNWHLHLEVFDPHEPFDCPSKYRDMYDDSWDRYFYNWPEYAPLDPELDDEKAVSHIRKSYAGTLTMADHWLGAFLGLFDKYDLWKDTAVILTTDHGHLLGEHGYWAKNYMMDYEQHVHIPLIMHSPSSTTSAGKSPGSRINELTATIDLAPTFADLHGAPPISHAHGSSIMPIIDGNNSHHDDGVLYGYFGKDIGMTDGRYSYCRQPLTDSIAYHHTAMPRSFADFIPREKLAAAETGRFLPHCANVPHYRIPVKSTRHVDAPDFNPIYDLEVDPEQTAPIRDTVLEEQLAEKMVKLMNRADAPESEYRRVGLTELN